MPIFDTQSRDELRRVYIEAWRKHRERRPMEPLEAQIADVIALHPEYQAALEQPDEVVDRDYTPEGGQSNPFLHMGLHLAVRDHEELAGRLRRLRTQRHRLRWSTADVATFASLQLQLAERAFSQ